MNPTKLSGCCDPVARAKHLRSMGFKMTEIARLTGLTYSQVRTHTHASGVDGNSVENVARRLLAAKRVPRELTKV